MPYRVSADDLVLEADRLAGKATSSTGPDATDRVAVAVYQVGAAIAERLDVLIAKLQK